MEEIHIHFFALKAPGLMLLYGKIIWEQYKITIKQFLLLNFDNPIIKLEMHLIMAGKHLVWQTEPTIIILEFTWSNI